MEGRSAKINQFLVAVSYTHLDVYKRQAQDCLGGVVGPDEVAGGVVVVEALGGGEVQVQADGLIHLSLIHI